MLFLSWLDSLLQLAGYVGLVSAALASLACAEAVLSRRGTFPACRSSPESLPKSPACEQRPSCPRALPAVQDFLPSANLHCRGFANRPGLEPERQCSYRAEPRLPWENDRRFAGQSRRHKGVGVVLQGAFRFFLNPEPAFFAGEGTLLVRTHFRKRSDVPSGYVCL